MVRSILMNVFLVSLCVWLVVRLKRHPEKDGKMKKVMAEQRGTEYEERMRKYLMFNYVATGLAIVMGVLLQYIFGIDEVPSMFTAFCVLCFVLIIAHWRFTGEFSKFLIVFTAFWLVATIVCLISFFKYTNPKPATIEVSDVYITAKGTGSRAKIPLEDITSANMLSTWPAISFPSGLSTDKVNIGHFPLKNGEECMMFVCTDGGPVLEVRTVDGKLYYLNCATEEETLEMIEKVKEILNKRPVTGNHYHDTLYRHGGQGSAISCTRRRIPVAWEIAGQARNDGSVLRFSSRHCEARSNPDNQLCPWIASSFLLSMT